MAKNKTRIPLGPTQVGAFNNPFAALGGAVAPPAAPDAHKVAPEVKAPVRKPQAVPTARKAQGHRVSVHAERKGRGGKTVTVVSGLRLREEALHELAKAMRHALGCGATVEGDSVILQGDQVDRARVFVANYKHPEAS